MPDATSEFGFNAEDAKNAEIRGENQAKTLRASAFSALFALRSSVQIHEIRIESRNREAVGGDAGLLKSLTQPVRGQLLNAAVGEANVTIQFVPTLGPGDRSVG